MTDTQIADIWLLIKEYVDKKAIEDLAERYVDLLADHGVSDRILKESIGHDDALDDAIEYYLGSEDPEEEEEQDNWDFDKE